jgi:hypothetical protein
MEKVVDFGKMGSQVIGVRCTSECISMLDGQKLVIFELVGFRGTELRGMHWNAYHCF